MDAREQVELTAAAVTSFFDAHLAKTPETRRDACGYLLHKVPDHPAVSIE
jgi:hypothetical protein